MTLMVKKGTARKIPLSADATHQHPAQPQPVGMVNPRTRRVIRILMCLFFWAPTTQHRIRLSHGSPPITAATQAGFSTRHLPQLSSVSLC